MGYIDGLTGLRAIIYGAGDHREIVASNATKSAPIGRLATELNICFWARDGSASGAKRQLSRAAVNHRVQSQAKFRSRRTNVNSDRR